MPGGALDGIRVVEFGQVVSAPYCAKLFADYGADVVKVEPLTGDMRAPLGAVSRRHPASGEERALLLPQHQQARHRARRRDAGRPR